MTTDDDRLLTDALIEPEVYRALPVAIVISLLVAVVMLWSASAVAPDADERSALSRSTSRVLSTDVRCSQGGHGPKATILVDGRYYNCGGVECDRGGAGGAPRMVRYNPADPTRCRAEEGLGGTTSWETQTTVTLGGGGVVALTILAAALVRYRAQRAARRAFYQSKTWKDYVAKRDGGEA